MPTESVPTCTFTPVHRVGSAISLRPARAGLRASITRQVPSNRERSAGVAAVPCAEEDGGLDVALVGDEFAAGVAQARPAARYASVGR